MSRRNTTVAVILGVAVVALFVGLGMFGGGFGTGVQNIGVDQEGEGNGAQDILTELSETGTVSELQIVEILEGEGAEVASGDVALVHYTGVLADGTVFDSSVNRGEPFGFQVGVGQVIQGWDQGVVGMKVGGRRLLAIPPELGYGARAIGNIPPNSTLIFEVELLEVIPAEQVQQGGAQ